MIPVPKGVDLYSLYYPVGGPVHEQTPMLRVMAAILELAGDDYGPWTTLVADELDTAVVALAVYTKLSSWEEEPRLTATSNIREQIATAMAGRRGATDIPSLSLVDRDRMVDAIGLLKDADVITRSYYPYHQLTAAALKSLTDIIKERVTIKAVGRYFLRYVDGTVTKRLRGALVPVNTGMLSSAAFTEEALGDDTKVNIPKQIQNAPQQDSDAAEISHNLTGRVVVVTRKSSPEVVTKIATGSKHVVKVSDLLHNHVITVEKAPAKSS